MTDSTYSGKKTAAEPLTIGGWESVSTAVMPTEGTHSHILLYVNISGILLPGRMGGTIDCQALRDGGSDETAVLDHAVNARQRLADGRYRFQAYLPHTWWLSKFVTDPVTKRAVEIGKMVWQVRPDRYSIAEATMTTRYAKAWNGQ